MIKIAIQLDQFSDFFYWYIQVFSYSSTPEDSAFKREVRSYEALPDARPEVDQLGFWAFAEKIRLGLNFKPEQSLFCPDIKICRDLHTIWKLLGQEFFGGVKCSVFGQEVPYYIVYIAYNTE